MTLQPRGPTRTVAAERTTSSATLVDIAGSTRAYVRSLHVERTLSSRRDRAGHPTEDIVPVAPMALSGVVTDNTEPAARIQGTIA
jgi:hypothetical protein